MYTNFTFMDDLIGRMVHDDPDKRPSITEAFAELKKIISKLSPLKLRERLVMRRDGHFMNLLKDIHYLSFRAVPNFLALRSPLPTPKI